MPDIIKARSPAAVDWDKQGIPCIAFRTYSGNKHNNVAWIGTGKQEIIGDCEDWLVVWDEDKCPAMFPSEIVTASRRPDITIYSPSEKQGIIIELTVPTEETLHRPTSGKLKYEDLIQKGQNRGFELKYFSVEVGLRGFTNNTLRTCFKVFGLTNKETRKAMDSVVRAALRSTHTLWLARNTFVINQTFYLQKVEAPKITLGILFWILNEHSVQVWEKKWVFHLCVFRKCMFCAKL